MEWNISRAINALNANARGKAKHQCAKYVRMAIEAGGISTAGRPVSACKYKGYLPKIGFNFVTTLYGRSNQASWSQQNAKVGDIAVMDHGVHGHICMWNGSRWISDFYQNNMWVYSGDGMCYLYRFTGEINNSGPIWQDPPQFQPTSGLPTGDQASVYNAPQNNTLGTTDTASESLIKDDQTRTRIYKASNSTIVLDEFSMPITPDRETAMNFNEGQESDNQSGSGGTESTTSPYQT